MQPDVQMTTRTPGPSTVAPVVNEWTNPMSPVASAARTSVSGTCAPRSTRSSYGLLASSGGGDVACVSDIASSSGYFRAVTVISTCPSPTSDLTTTVVRVGRGSLKYDV